MKIDRLKAKCKGAQPPADVQNLIKELQASAALGHEALAQKLSCIQVWKYSKSDFYYWHDIVDLFDDILAQATAEAEPPTVGNDSASQSTATKLSRWYMQVDIPQNTGLRGVVCEILHFFSLLIENTFSRSSFSSIDRLYQLLFSDNLYVVYNVLVLLYTFARRSNLFGRLQEKQKRDIFTILHMLASPWSSSSFTLAACCSHRQSLPPDATAVKFQCAAKPSSSSSPAESLSADGGIVIDANIAEQAEMPSAQIMFNLLVRTRQQSANNTNNNAVLPELDEKDLQKLFLRIRLAKHFTDPTSRVMNVQVRLQALTVLLHNNALSQPKKFLFNGFLDELVDILKLDEDDLADIKTCVLRTLTAIIHYNNAEPDRLRYNSLNSVLQATGLGSQYGTIPSIVRDCVNYLTAKKADDGSGGTSSSAADTNTAALARRFPVQYTTAIFSFLYHISNYGSGIDALTNADMMQTMLRIINHYESTDESLGFATRAVRVVDLLANNNLTLFRNANGFACMTARLAHEVQCCLQESQQQDQTLATTVHTCHPQRAALMKSALSFLKKAFPDAAFNDHANLRDVFGEETRNALKSIVERCEFFGPSLFLMTLDVITSFINAEPASLSDFQASGLTKAILDAVFTRKLPATREIIQSLPHTCNALCTNARGVEEFRAVAPFDRICQILLSEEYLPALRRKKTGTVDSRLRGGNEPAHALGSTIEQLAQHYPALRQDAMRAVVNMLNRLVEMGNSPTISTGPAKIPASMVPQLAEIINSNLPVIHHLPPGSPLVAQPLAAAVASFAAAMNGTDAQRMTQINAALRSVGGAQVLQQIQQQLNQANAASSSSSTQQPLQPISSGSSGNAHRPLMMDDPGLGLRYNESVQSMGGNAVDLIDFDQDDEESSTPTFSPPGVFGDLNILGAVTAASTGGPSSRVLPPPIGAAPQSSSTSSNIVDAEMIDQSNGQQPSTLNLQNEAANDAVPDTAAAPSTAAAASVETATAPPPPLSTVELYPSNFMDHDMSESSRVIASILGLVAGGSSSADATQQPTTVYPAANLNEQSFLTIPITVQSSSLAEIISNVACFTDAFINNVNMRPDATARNVQDFAAQNGIKAVIQLLKLSNVGLDFPLHVACSALAKLVRTLHNGWNNAVTASGLLLSGGGAGKLLDDILESLRTLIDEALRTMRSNLSGSNTSSNDVGAGNSAENFAAQTALARELLGVRACTLASTRTATRILASDAGGSNVAERCPLTQKLSQIHTHVYVLSSLCRSSARQISSSSGNNISSTFVLNPLTPQLVSYMVALYDMLVWESISLLSAGEQWNQLPRSSPPNSATAQTSTTNAASITASAPFSIENLRFSNNTNGLATMALDTSSAANNGGTSASAAHSDPSSSFSLTDALSLMANAAAASTSSAATSATNTVPTLQTTVATPAPQDTTTTASTRPRGEIAKLIQPTLTIITKLSCALGDLLQTICRMPYQQQVQQRHRRNRQGALIQQAQQQGLLAQANEKLFRTLAVSLKQSLLWEPPGSAVNSNEVSTESSSATQRRNDMRHMYLACMVSMLAKMLVSDSRQAFGDTLQAMLREGTLDVCSKLYYWSLQPLKMLSADSGAANTNDEQADISDDAERNRVNPPEHKSGAGNQQQLSTMSSAQCEFLAHWLELAQLLANKRVVVDASHSVTPPSNTPSPARGGESRSAPAANTAEQTATNNRDALVAIHKYIVPVLKQFYQHTEMYCALPSPIPAHYFSLLRAVLSSSDLVTSHLARQQQQQAATPSAAESLQTSNTASVSENVPSSSTSSTEATTPLSALPSSAVVGAALGLGSLPTVAEAGDSNAPASSSSSNPQPSFAEFIAAATAALSAGSSSSFRSAAAAALAPIPSAAATESSGASAAADVNPLPPPPPPPRSAAEVEQQRQSAITSVCEMGFDRPTAIRALHLNEWQVEPAVNLLLTLGPAQLQAMAAVYDDDDDLMESIERYSVPPPPPPPAMPSNLRPVTQPTAAESSSAGSDASRHAGMPLMNATETLNEAADVRETATVVQATLSEDDYNFLRSDVVPLINIMSFLAGSGGAGQSTSSSRPPNAAGAVSPTATKYSADIVFRVVDIVQLCARQNGPEWRERLITLVVERIIEHVESVTHALRSAVEACAEPDKLVQTIQQFDQCEPASVKLEAYLHFAALLLERSSGKPYWHVIFYAKNTKVDSDQPLFQQFHEALMSLVSTARYVFQQVKRGSVQASQWLTLAFVLLDLSDRQCLAQQRNAYARQRYTNGRWKYFDIRTSRWLPFDAVQCEAIDKAFDEGKNDAQITFTDAGVTSAAQQQQAAHRNTPFSTVYFDHMVLVNHRTNTRRPVMREVDEFDAAYDAAKKSKLAKSSVGSSAGGMKAPASTPSDLGKTKRDEALHSAPLNNDSKDTASAKKRQKSSSDSSMQSQQPSPATRRTVKTLKRAHTGGARGGARKNTLAADSTPRGAANNKPTVPLTNKTSSGAGKPADSVPQTDTNAMTPPPSDDCFAPPYSISSLSKDQQHAVMLDSIELIKTGQPLLLNAIMRYMLRLTRSPSNAMFFVKSGGLRALFGLTRSAYFPEFTSLLTHIVRHVIEQPPVLIKRMVDVVDFILHNVYSKTISSSFQGSGPSITELNNDIFITLNRLWPAALRSPYMMELVAKRLMGVTVLPGVTTSSSSSDASVAGSDQPPPIAEKLVVERRPAGQQQQQHMPSPHSQRATRVAGNPPASAGPTSRTTSRPSTTPNLRHSHHPSNAGSQFSFDAITNCNSPATTSGAATATSSNNTFEELFMRHSDQVSYDALVRSVVEDLLSLLVIRQTTSQRQQKNVSTSAAGQQSEDAQMDDVNANGISTAPVTRSTKNVQTKSKALYENDLVVAGNDQSSSLCVLSRSNVLDMLAHLLHQYPLVLTHIANAVVVESSTGSPPRVTTLFAAMDETGKTTNSGSAAGETVMEVNGAYDAGDSATNSEGDKVTSAITYILDNLLTERDLMAQVVRDELSSISAQEVLHVSRSAINAAEASLTSRSSSTTLPSGGPESSTTSHSAPPPSTAAVGSDVGATGAAQPSTLPPAFAATNNIANTHYSQFDVEDCCASVQYLFRAIASTTEAPNSQFRVVEDIRKLFSMYAQKLFLCIKDSSGGNNDAKNRAVPTTNTAAAAAANGTNAMAIDSDFLSSPGELAGSVTSREFASSSDYKKAQSALSAGDIAHKLKALCVVVHHMLSHAQNESMPAGDALAHASKNKRILAKIVHGAASNTVARLIVKSGLARDLGRLLTYCSLDSAYFGSLANALLKPIELLSYQATLTLANNVVSCNTPLRAPGSAAAAKTSQSRQSPRKDISSNQRIPTQQQVSQEQPVVTGNNNNAGGIDILNDSIVSDLDASTSGDDDQDVGGADTGESAGGVENHGSVVVSHTMNQTDRDEIAAAVDFYDQMRAGEEQNLEMIMAHDGLQDDVDDEGDMIQFGALSNGGADRAARRRHGRNNNNRSAVVTIDGGGRIGDVMADIIDEVQAQLDAAGAAEDSSFLAGEIAAAIVDESVAAAGGGGNGLAGQISVDVGDMNDDADEEIDENAAESNDDDEAGNGAGVDDEPTADESDDDDDDDNDDEEDDDDDEDENDDDDEDANEQADIAYNLASGGILERGDEYAEDDDEDDSLADEYEDAQDENSFTSEYDDDDDEDEDETLIANGGGASGDNSLLGAVRNVAELYFDQQAFSSGELDDLVNSFQNMQQTGNAGVGYRQRARQTFPVGFMPYVENDDADHLYEMSVMQSLNAVARGPGGGGNWAIRTGGPPGGLPPTGMQHQPPHHHHITHGGNHHHHQTQRVFVPSTGSPLPLSHPLLLPPRAATGGAGMDLPASSGLGTSSRTMMMNFAQNHPLMEPGMSASVELGPMMRDAAGGVPMSTASVQMIDSNGNPLPASVAQAWAPSLLRLAAGATGPIHGGNVRIEVVAVRNGNNPAQPLPGRSGVSHIHRLTAGSSSNHHQDGSASGRNRAATGLPAAAQADPSNTQPANAVATTTNNVLASTSTDVSAPNDGTAAQQLQQREQEQLQQQRRSAVSVSMLMRMLGYTPAASSPLVSPQDSNGPSFGGGSLINPTPDVMSADASFLEAQSRMPILSRHMPRHLNAAAHGVNDRDLLAAAGFVPMDPAVVSAGPVAPAAGSGTADVSQSELAANYAAIAEEAARNLPMPLQDLYVTNPATAAPNPAAAGSADDPRGGSSSRDMTFSQLLRQQHGHRPMMASPNMMMMPDRYLSALTGGIGAVAAMQMGQSHQTPNAATSNAAASTSGGATRSAVHTPPLSKLRRATMCSLLRSWSESGWACEAHEYLTIINMLRPALAMFIIRHKLEFSRRVLSQAATAAAAAAAKTEAAASSIVRETATVNDAAMDQSQNTLSSDAAATSAEQQSSAAIPAASGSSVDVDSEAHSIARINDLRHDAFVRAMRSLDAPDADADAPIADADADPLDDDDDDGGDMIGDDYAALSATLAATASRLSAANETLAASLRTLADASNVINAAAREHESVDDAPVEMDSEDAPEVSQHLRASADEEMAVSRSVDPVDVGTANVVDEPAEMPLQVEIVNNVTAAQLPQEQANTDPAPSVVPETVPTALSAISPADAPAIPSENVAPESTTPPAANVENVPEAPSASADTSMSPAAIAIADPSSAATASTTGAASVPAHDPDDDIPDELPADFLRELPEDMRSELVSQHRRTIRLRDERRQRVARQLAAAQAAGSSSSGAAGGGDGTSSAATMPDVSEVDPDILAQLPPEIQEEVLAQQRAAAAARQERENIAAGNTSAAGGSNAGGATGSSSTNDPAAFFSTLAPDLRRQVLMDMDDSQLTTLPDNLRQEAQTLRRSNPRRFAATQEEMLARLEAEQQALEQAAAGVGRARRMVASMANAAGLSSSSAAAGAGGGRFRGYALANGGGRLLSMQGIPFTAEDAARLVDDGVITAEEFNNWYATTTSNGGRALLPAGQSSVGGRQRSTDRPGAFSAFEAAAGLPSALVQRQGGNRYVLTDNAGVRSSPREQSRRNVGFMPSSLSNSAATTNTLPPSSGTRPVFGRQVFDLEGMTCLTMILTACSSTSADSIDLARLQRILRNLCLHGPTRQFVIASLVSLLNKCGQASHEPTGSQTREMRVNWLTMRTNTSGNSNKSTAHSGSGHEAMVTDDNDFSTPSVAAGEAGSSMMLTSTSAKPTTIFTIRNTFLNPDAKLSTVADSMIAVRPEAASFLCQLLLGTLQFLAQHFPDALLPFVVTRNFDLRTCKVAVLPSFGTRNNADNGASLLGLKSVSNANPAASLSPPKQQQQQFATNGRRGTRGAPVAAPHAVSSTNNEASNVVQHSETIWDVALDIEVCHFQNLRTYLVSSSKDLDKAAAVAQIARHSTVLVPQIPLEMQLMLTPSNSSPSTSRTSTTFATPITPMQSRQTKQPGSGGYAEFPSHSTPFQYPLVQSVKFSDSPLASVVRLLNQPLARTGGDGVTDAVLRCCKLLFSSLKQREVVVPMRASALYAYIERSQQLLAARKAALSSSQQTAATTSKSKTSLASRTSAASEVVNTGASSAASGDAVANVDGSTTSTVATPAAEPVLTEKQSSESQPAAAATSSNDNMSKRNLLASLSSLLIGTKSVDMARWTQVVPERLFAHAAGIESSLTASDSLSSMAVANRSCFDTVVSAYASRRVRSSVVENSSRARKALLSVEHRHNSVDDQQETIVAGLECLVEPFEFGKTAQHTAPSAEESEQNSAAAAQCVMALQKLVDLIDLHAYSTRAVMSAKREEVYNSSNAVRSLLMDNDRIEKLVEQATRDFATKRLPEIVMHETSPANGGGKSSAKSLLACLGVELRQTDEITTLLNELMQCLQRQPRRAGQLGLLDACSVLGRACEKLGFASRAASLQLLVSSLIDLALKEVLVDLEQLNEEVVKRLTEKQQQQATAATKPQGRTLNAGGAGAAASASEPSAVAAMEGEEAPPVMPRLPHPAARRVAPAVLGGGRGGMPATGPPACQFSFTAASKFTSKNGAQLGVYSLLKAALQCQSRFFANRQAYDVYYMGPNSTINSILGRVIDDYVHYIEKVLRDECVTAMQADTTTSTAKPIESDSMDVDVPAAVNTTDAAVTERPVTAAEVSTAASAAAASANAATLPSTVSTHPPAAASIASQAQQSSPQTGFNIEPPAIEVLPQFNVIQQVWETLSQTLANLEELGDIGSALLLLPLIESFFLLYAPQPTNVLSGPITSSLVEMFSSPSGQWTMAFAPQSRRGAAAAAAAHQQYLFGAGASGAHTGSLSALQQLQMLNPFGTSSSAQPGTAAGGAAGDAGGNAQFLFGHYQRPTAVGGNAAAGGSGRTSHLADMAPGGPTRSYQIAMAAALGRGGAGSSAAGANSAVITDNSFRQFFGAQTSVMAANAAAAAVIGASSSNDALATGGANGAGGSSSHPRVIDVESYGNQPAGYYSDLHGSSSSAASAATDQQQQQSSNSAPAAAGAGGSALTSTGVTAFNPNVVFPIYSQNNMMMLITFAERHKTLINEILRYSSVHITESPFAVLISLTRVLDFDVKRRFFRQQLDIVDRMSNASRASQLRGMGRFADTVLRVRRGSVFEDSFRDLHRGGPDKWRSRFYIIFENEEGQDAGGLLREWYTIMAREIFNPMYGLFKTAPGDRATYMINPASYINSNHLSYFKFVGRFIAKAILDNKLLDCFFTRSFYKHMLGKPVRYTDMESEDPDFYNGLIFLLTHNVSELGYDLTFSTEVQEYGVTQIGDLKPNGRNIPVTDENKNEYVPLVCQMKMTHAIKQQLKSFLEGFYELIPNHLISMFNEQELELLISGMPQIDVDDLRNNTDYHRYDSTSPQIVWFWQALKSFQQEERAKFLQFVTGTSKVPLQGFAALEGMNGTQKLQVFRDDRGNDRLPCAHTCFNQLDLPPYETYEKLRQMLLYAVNECSEGFGFA